MLNPVFLSIVSIIALALFARELFSEPEDDKRERTERRRSSDRTNE